MGGMNAHFSVHIVDLREMSKMNALFHLHFTICCMLFSQLRCLNKNVLSQVVPRFYTTQFLERGVAEDGQNSLAG